MPRKPRLHVPGGIYHVILRGNARQPIFFDVEDRRRWEALIDQGTARYGHRIHAYCWMSNHVHIAVECGDDPLGNFVQYVASRYARCTNQKLKRSGHLFERRHRAILVDAETYLLQLVRYIHNNPVRAGLVAELSQYRWSSHLAYVGNIRPGWLTLSFVLGMFGDTEARARRQYLRFMGAPNLPSPADSFSTGNSDDRRVFGSEEFAHAVTPTVPSPAGGDALETMASEVCREFGVSLERLRSASRERHLVRIRTELSVRALNARIAKTNEIAAFLNRSPAAISQAIRRWQQKR